MEDYWKDLAGKNFLITGGLGFIGSNLTRKLVEIKKAGIKIGKIIIVDSLEKECGGNVNNVRDIKEDIEIYNFNIEDKENMGRLIKEADFVFNLAGQTGHMISMENPLLDIELNYKSHVSLLETCRENNPDIIIVYASTRQIYGEPKFLPVTEEHPINPVDANGINHFASEQMHILYNKIYGIKSCSLRLTNTFGPRQRIKDAKLGVLGFFIGLNLKNCPISLYEKGNLLRDITYVDDAVEAFILAALKIEKTNGRVFNIGGEKMSLLDFVKLLVRINYGNYEFKEFPSEQKKISIEEYYADYSEFTKITGWTPKTSVEDGIKKTIEYYKKNFEDYLE